MIAILSIVLLLLTILSVCPLTTQIIAILEFIAITVYAVYSYKLWQTTKNNTEINRNQIGLLKEQLNLQFKPIVAVDDIDGEIYVDNRNRSYLVINIAWLNSGYSVAKIDEYEMHVLLTDKLMQTIKDLGSGQELTVGYYKGSILPQTTQSVRLFYEMGKEEIQKINDAEFIIEPMITTYFKWEELNKKYQVHQTFALIKNNLRALSETGRKFNIVARHLDLKEMDVSK